MLRARYKFIFVCHSLKRWKRQAWKYQARNSHEQKINDPEGTVSRKPKIFSSFTQRNEQADRNITSIYAVVSKTKHSKTKTEKRSTQHPAPKSRKRSTQNSKTKHPKLETCLSFKNTRQSLLKSPMLTQQKSSTITNRLQFKTIQVELRGEKLF